MDDEDDGAVDVSTLDADVRELAGVDVPDVDAASVPDSPEELGVKCEDVEECAPASSDSTETDDELLQLASVKRPTAAGS